MWIESPNDETVIGYRLDRHGRLYSRLLGGAEEEVRCRETKLSVLTHNPELALSLVNKG